MSAPGSDGSAQPVDAAARGRIRGELGATLFVEAGAGTGKTTELVARIVALVGSGAELSTIAAITFTEAAAAELRERVRMALERAVFGGGGSPPERVRWRAALESIDEAALSTLHGFAQRILMAHAVAAGLPPGFELVDATEMAIRFERRWTGFLNRLYHSSDPDTRRDLILAIDLGLSSEQLRVVAAAFHQNWDLLLDAPPEPPGALGEPVDAAPLLAAIDAAVDMAAECAVSNDKLHVRLLELVPARAAIVAAGDDERAVAAAVHGWRAPKVGNVGRAPQWRCPVDVVRRAVKAAADARDSLLDGVRQRVLSRLLGELAAFTLDGAEERRAAGVLEFHDLLVRARQLLRDPAVRRAVQAAFAHVLVDEFQDTDPLQVELAVLLAVPDAVDEPGPWQRAARVEGRLFFVGDPKQSIYRFRRADIQLYAQVRDRLGTDRVGLEQNWRSLPPILDFVNGVFGPMLQAGGEHQAPWAELAPGRASAAGRFGTVALVGGVDPGRSEEARQVEADDIARAVLAMKAQAWQVVGADGAPRPARYDDVALLLPSRAALPALERAFEEEGVPYRVESRSLVWATQEVRDLLAVVRAVDDPTDQVAVVAALRSTAFGCSDDHLVEWRRAGGQWGHDVAPPEGLPALHPVTVAMAEMAALARRRLWVAPSCLIEEIVRSRRFLEVAYAKPRQRETWNRARFVIEQARAYAAAGGSTLRGFVDWAEEQAAQEAQALESVVPEADDDAVRILTIHASKGLEFPIVVLAGLSVGHQRSERAQVLWAEDGRPEVRCGPAQTGFTTPGYAAAKAEDDLLADHEVARLLYVAGTRARDHLVVSLHRPERGGASTLAGRLSGFVDGVVVTSRTIEELANRWPSTGGASADRGAPEPLPADGVWAALAQAEERRRLSLDAANRPAAVAATAVADLPDPAALALAVPTAADGNGAAAGVTDDEGRPGSGRPGSGTAFGIAVHAVLERVPLDAQPGDVADAAVTAATEVGMVEAADAIERAARAALSSVAAREAAAGRHWREVFVGASVESTTVEGFVDLLYEHGDGLVVVDWKTDAVDDRAALAAKVAHYGLQLATYAEALSQVTGRPVVRCVMVFCGSGRVREVEVADLPGRRAAVRSRLAALTAAAGIGS